ncbi:MAG: hypothetical protein FWG87_11125 [Defluviitaleaceae bacterium]|nr:hypothetical protein [Defluviitaleaceae bacterium]
MNLIYTNNYAVANFFEQNKDRFKVEIKWLGVPAIDVLAAAKTAAKNGSILLSNPLTGVGSMRMDLQASRPTPQKVRALNPCISVILSPPQDTIDLASVSSLNDTYEVYKKNARLRFAAHSDADINRMQAHDLEHVIVTLTSLERIGNR